MARGQVTGQDVLLLWTYRHVNTLQSCQELFQALGSDHWYCKAVSMAPGTALPCATSSPPDHLAPGSCRGPRSLPKCLFRRCLMAQMGVVRTAEWLWAMFSLQTQLRVNVFKPVRWLPAACVAVTRLGLLKLASLFQSPQWLWRPFQGPALQVKK